MNSFHLKIHSNNAWNIRTSSVPCLSTSIPEDREKSEPEKEKIQVEWKKGSKQQDEALS
jgi:hypothetical protein